MTSSIQQVGTAFCCVIVPQSVTQI